MSDYNPDERRISVFADNQTGRDDLQALAVQMGLRVMFCGTVDDGLSRLRAFSPGDAIVVDVTCDSGPAGDMFFDRLDAVGADDDIPVIVNCSPECLDRVAARLHAPSTALMCQATRSDWITSLALIRLPGVPALHDVAVDESIRLQRLAEEVQRIARALSDLVTPGATPGATPLSGMSDAMIGFRAPSTSYTVPPTASVTAADVRAIIRLRRMRDRFFRSDLFADPAWDMLLDLMAARLERMRVAVSSLCIAAAVPPTTALRWIKTMGDNGMFVRVADPEDGRRMFIELSDTTAAAMTSYLSAAKSQGGLAV